MIRVEKEKLGLLYYIKPTYSDEANEWASAIAKNMNEALIKSGFRKSMKDILEKWNEKGKKYESDEKTNRR